MNISSKVRQLAPISPRETTVTQASRLRRATDFLLGKVLTLLLAAGALALGVATFVVLAGGLSFGVDPNVVYALVLANLVVLLPLGAALAGRVTRVWVERRRGSAGSRLHVRLVLLFSGVAVTPAIVVAVFATFFFHFGIQAWFNEPVRTALSESLQASRGYLEEHKINIRGDALGMANELMQGAAFGYDPNRFGQVLAQQAETRGITEAIVYDSVNGQVLVSTGLMSGLGVNPPPPWAVEMARTGEVAVLGSEDGTRVRAVVQLDTTPPVMLVISRPIDPTILAHMARTEQAVAQYDRLDQNQSGLQITLAEIFVVVALLVLCAAALIGLVLANQIARPIGGLITAAERVRSGDLSVRVPEVASGDEVAGLSRAFNRMIGQLASQRTELMDAYSQIDERRRFTEAVLSGVSAGVIGLDGEGRIELPNRAASDLLATDLLAAIGLPLIQVVPEFAPLIEAVRDAPDKPGTAEVQIGPSSARRTVLVRIGADRGPKSMGPRAVSREFGFVATFDDITELQSAQRKAAWADVARRIAHEIKNPLTPIQLSAERLKRRFLKEIKSDPETFAQCADTIVRHVGDIGRMVDEFSAFARMPQPVIKLEDIGRIARDALVLQRQARTEIEWRVEIPSTGPMAPCDRRLVGQAMTNLLQNAAESILMRVSEPRPDGQPGEAARGVIDVTVGTENGRAFIRVSDNGIGLPVVDRDRLTEPYVTHKPKGTGLGLAIVKKIMEDHGGKVLLLDRQPSHDWPSTRDDPSLSPGAVAMLVLPLDTIDG